jgi:hypothetical protein
LLQLPVQALNIPSDCKDRMINRRSGISDDVTEIACRRALRM